MKFFQALLTSVACFVLAAFAATPAINSPADGTAIQPGAAFDFSYASIADYGTSSYNYTVWLFTTPPTGTKSVADWASGYYFGRYGQPNYPGNPNPSNLPPAQLVMPNFAKIGGGFGTGASASNATFYLAVVEEYLSGSNLGYKMNLVYNKIHYNVTA